VAGSSIGKSQRGLPISFKAVQAAAVVRREWTYSVATAMRCILLAVFGPFKGCFALLIWGIPLYK
jgi:hypothetical protein